MTHRTRPESAWLLNKVLKFLAKQNSYDIMNLYVSKLIICLDICEFRNGLKAWFEKLIVVPLTNNFVYTLSMNLASLSFPYFFGG